MRRVDGGRVVKPWLTPTLPAYSPGGAGGDRAYGVGAGRSARGLPILIDSPVQEEMRGVVWRMSVDEVSAEERGEKRKGSMLADDRLAKKRREGT